MNQDSAMIAALRRAASRLGEYAGSLDGIEGTDAQIALGVQRMAARLADIGERVGDPADNLERFITARKAIGWRLLDAPGEGIELVGLLASIVGELAAADTDPRPAAIRAAGGGDMGRVVGQFRGYLTKLGAVIRGISKAQSLDNTARRLFAGANAAARARAPELFAMRDLAMELRETRRQAVHRSGEVSA